MTRLLTLAAVILIPDAVVVALILFLIHLWHLNPHIVIDLAVFAGIGCLGYLYVFGLKTHLPTDPPLPISTPAWSAQAWAELDYLRDRDNFAEVEDWRGEAA